jgi:hypothetical protein
MMKKLNEIPDKNPFKVPDNYFEEFNRKIISVTTGNDQLIGKTGLYDRLKPYFLIAASVAGFILLSYTAVKLLTPAGTDSGESAVLSNEYSDYYLNNFDITTLEENAASLVIPEDGADLNKTDIIDYLLLENIEFSDIYEQL